MFRISLFPEKMKFVWILTFKSRAAEVLSRIGQEKCLHVVDAPKIVDLPPLHLEPEEGFYSQVERFARLLDIKPVAVPFSLKAYYRAKAWLVEQVNQLKEILEEIDQIEKEIDILDDVSFVLDVAQQHGIELPVKWSRFSLWAGFIPPANVDSLKRAFGEDSVFVCGIHKNRACVFLVLPSELDPSQTLQRLHWHSVDISEAGSTDPEVVEMKAWQLRERLYELKEKVLLWKKKNSAEFAKGLYLLGVMVKVSRMASSVSSTESFSLITGWVPVSLLQRLKKIEDEAVVGLEEVDVTPPTRLSQAAPVQPFTEVTTTYGLPAYQKIDPTPVVAFTFPLLFGMMFGDIGHGALISIFGFILSRLRMRLGWVVLACGISSVVFGFLYGSVFCFDIEPLWLSPSPLRGNQFFILMGISLAIGAFLISLGILFNIVQHIFKNFREALFGEWGLTSLLFYWSLLACIISLLLKKVYLFLYPLPLIFFILIMLRQPLTGEKLSMEGLFGSLEQLTSVFTNTLSFIRIAAFSMNHAVLSGTIFLIRESIGGSLLGLDIILGNVFIIILEGVIVTIQNLRLHYYEFFSKFFDVSGYPFKPLEV